MKNAGGQNQDSGKPFVQTHFQRLEALEQEANANGHTGHNRWMIPYADLLTLLLGLFMVLIASTQADLQPVMAETSPGTTQEIQDLPMSTIESTREDHMLAEKLRNEWTDALAREEIEIRQQERGLVISLKDSILFAPGSAELSGSARQTLDRLASQLAVLLAENDGEARPIRVEGHTDNAPINTAVFPSNWELSTARATNIVRHLISGHQIPQETLSAAGYGEFKPVADNSTIEGKQKNRRVDIVILSTNMAQQEPPALSLDKSRATEETGTRED